MPQGSEPRVTVVVPCYDDEPDHLREALGSVSAQTVDPSWVEVVVVDDGTTRPDLLSLLASLERPGLRVIRQENAGLPAARNTAVAAARTEFVLPLDADDLLTPTFVAECFEVLEADPSLRFVYSALELFGAVEDAKLPPDELRLADFFPGNRIACTAMFRRADWARLGGYDESLRHGFEDYEWWVRLLGPDDVARRIPTARLRYRIRAGSLTARHPADALAATRAAILANNADRLAELVRAGWADADRREVRLAAASDEVARWRRRTRHARTTVGWVRERVRPTR